MNLSAHSPGYTTAITWIDFDGRTPWFILVSQSNYDFEPTGRKAIGFRVQSLRHKDRTSPTDPKLALLTEQENPHGTTTAQY